MMVPTLRLPASSRHFHSKGFPILSTSHWPADAQTFQGLSYELYEVEACSVKVFADSISSNEFHLFVSFFSLFSPIGQV